MIHKKLNQHGYDHDPAWRGRVTAVIFSCILLWPMLVMTEFSPWVLLDKQSLHASAKFIISFFPPAHSIEFLQLALTACWETVAMATAGMTLALLGAIPMSLLITENFSLSRLGTGKVALLPSMFRQLIRWFLILLRSVPELVWALLLVRIVGLGPTAGVVAIALSYCGMLGKVYAEILESSDDNACNSLLRNGCGRMTALLYGALPECAAELTSYTVYRWECAIRGSVVMGFVGAGGLGQRMEESIKMMAGGELSSMLIMFIALVAVADGVSGMLRRRLV
ncbi:PhnE/PtxC family ABC transporter permease [Undibacterium sp. SXout7W]|uniref:PhnE/PtxC family ABC transporter permease n=1 Tax=Undibacterium sp. SXout7W TaxID=3413049 RepID=UPI003BEF97DC